MLVFPNVFHVESALQSIVFKKASASKQQQIASLCMIIACLDDESEGIRKKGPDRDCLRRRAERESFACIVKKLLAGLFPMS